MSSGEGSPCAYWIELGPRWSESSVCLLVFSSVVLLHTESGVFKFPAVSPFVSVNFNILGFGDPLLGTYMFLIVKRHHSVIIVVRATKESWIPEQ